MSRRLQDVFWDVDLSGTEQVVAQRLAWHADDETGRCWPGIALLCKKTGLCTRAVQNAIKSLVASGHVSREETPGYGVTYFVHPRLPEQRAASGDEKPAHLVQGRIKRTPAPNAGTPARRAGKQVKKPSDEKHEGTPAMPERITGQRGRRIDIDWQPEKPLPEALAKVVSGWPPGRYEDKVTEFRDFWLSDAGQRASKMDWDRTWWNRIRAINEHDRRHEGQRRNGQRDHRHRPSAWGTNHLPPGAEAASLDEV